MSKINVLDRGFVELIDHMGTDLSVCNAARVSFSKESKEWSEKDQGLLRYLLKHGHTSPLRHCQMTFRVKAPIFVFRQWMKHRIASEFNEMSSRYVELGNAEFYHPEVFREQSTDNKQGSQGSVNDDYTNLAHGEYSCATDEAQISYNTLRKYGVAKEQARCVLPVSQYSEAIWTVSLQAALHFITLRTDAHAQWEIQQYAQAVKTIVSELFPAVVMEYEAAERTKQAKELLAISAIKLALADVLFESNPSDENIDILSGCRDELRKLTCEYADCFASELRR